MEYLITEEALQETIDFISEMHDAVKRPEYRAKAVSAINKLKDEMESQGKYDLPLSPSTIRDVAKEINRIMQEPCTSEITLNDSRETMPRGHHVDEFQALIVRGRNGDN